MKKKIMVVFGTRPEAIKMGPVIHELINREKVQTVICVTGQHEELLQQVLDIFNIKPDYNLEVMKANQNLFDITINILNKIKDVLLLERPDIVLVHGDTTTAYAAALACFYLGIKVAHVEAGLRTYNIHSPFPEEFNRKSISLIADYNFAPTEHAKENLILEKCKNVIVTGNTVIDALKMTVSEQFTHPLLEWIDNSKMILLTAHRRENLGNPMKDMFAGIKKFASEFPTVKIVYPIHPNNKVREIALEVFDKVSNIKIIEPLDVVQFHNFIKLSYFVMTDSGGVQEEAPSLNKPVLVMRRTTERPEGVKAGALKLVGTSGENIYSEMKTLLLDHKEYLRMCESDNPYGDGYASERIVNVLENMNIEL